eukprot:CAMPEP_0176344358 /NCGR_PEP_ID=MMETSP0126-20121128/4648_1 /TAXON_ID=141414 ORGANISM="Strombidinopsis acuminatum, Strain SPMC142" /NCGR_SAMPLE_ID=MMETSP0126 /ASSEMBLY_ACC=CAM_ASM_000229 /LENGTH=47 /DNA_ID= /DNA_START= /DNA_END= /DNA_ORIENTATION=
MSGLSINEAGPLAIQCPQDKDGSRKKLLVAPGDKQLTDDIERGHDSE